MIAPWIYVEVGVAAFGEIPLNELQVVSAVASVGVPVWWIRKLVWHTIDLRLARHTPFSLLGFRGWVWEYLDEEPWGRKIGPWGTSHGIQSINHFSLNLPRPHCFVCSLQCFSSGREFLLSEGKYGAATKSTYWNQKPCLLDLPVQLMKWRSLGKSWSFSGLQFPIFKVSAGHKACLRIFVFLMTLPDPLSANMCHLSVV